MQVGIVDFAAHTTGFIQTLFPRFAVLDLPYLFNDRAVAEKVLDGPVGDMLFADMPAKGIYGLSWIHWGWRPVTTVDRPAPKPDDLKGLKIRVQPGAIYAATYKTLGAVPVTIDVSEVYRRAIAARRRRGRVADHLDCRPEGLRGREHHQPHQPRLQRGRDDGEQAAHGGAAGGYQKAIKDAARALSPPWRNTTVTLTDDLTGFIKQQGVQVLPVDTEAYRAATRPIYDQFRPSIGSDLVDTVMKQAASA